MDRLPDDLLLNHILPLLDYTGRIRLSAVSKRLKSLSRLIPLPHMPWMIGFSGWKQTPFLLDLNSRDPASLTVTFPAPPEISSLMFSPVGAVDGYAIVSSSSPSHGTELTLYSPFSGETRRIIPHPTGLPSGHLLISLARFLPEHGLVVAVDYWDHLFVGRLGRHDWVELDITHVSDFIFHLGQLFCICKGGAVYSFDSQQLLDNPRIVEAKLVSGYIYGFLIGFPRAEPSLVGSSIDPLAVNYCDYGFHNLVECMGELLVVTRWGVRSKSLDETSDTDLVKCWVAKIDYSRECTISGMPFVPLMPVYDLGGRMLFIRDGCSMSYPGNGESSFEFLSKNCIYFIHPPKKKLGSCYLGKFSMEGIETKKSIAVFHPQCIKSCRPPFWINPSSSIL